MAETNRRWRREMLTYLCFTLPGAFFPIGCLWAARAYQGYPLRTVDVVADGGILAIAIGLYADAFARIINSGTRWLELKIVLGGCTTVAMAGGSFFYGLRYVRGATNSVVFLDLCVLVFIVSVVIATFCRFFPEDN